MTSPRVIAVLEAGGRADQDLLYVEISRASEGFELVVDDRELLAERLAERPGIDEGALEAIGADLAAPVVDPELFAGLQADWRSLRRRADEEGRVLYLADGYGEVVAQIAALGVIEDLPADMRRFVDTVLEEHAAHQQRDDKIRGLAESLGSHWRQWPELCWKASSLGVAPEALDQHRQWRGDGDRLAAQARDLLVDRGEDGRHLSAMEGVRSGLESSLARIEKVWTFDDLSRFERGWTGIILNASKTSVPEIHVPGYRDVAKIGKRLAGAEGLDDSQRRMIANWQKADRLQGELTVRIESLPNEAAALVERAGGSFAEASGNAENVPDAAWKNQCETLAEECRAMLDPDSDHAPHLDVIAGARDRISEAGSFLETALLEMDISSFHGLARAVKNWAGKTGGLEIDAPDYPKLMQQASTLGERNGVSVKNQETIKKWMNADAHWKKARAEVGEFVKLVVRVEGERKEHEAKCREAGRLLSAPSHLREGAEQVCGTAERLESGMDAGERNVHIHAAGKNPDSLDSTVRKIHDWLVVENRGSHIKALRANQRALRRLSWKVASTVRWHRHEPLVPGDRLRWTGTDTSGAKPQYSEAIVLSISAGNRPGKVDSIMIEMLRDSARASRGSGKKKTLQSKDLNNLTENCGCRRVRWPDKSVRRMEWTRQMPESDEVYSIKCTGRLAPGDRIRFNPGSGSGGHGDAPLIEAVVEKIEIPTMSFKVAITLRVTDSWGLDDPPAPGTSITREQSTLFARGVYRALWKDEGQRKESQITDKNIYNDRGFGV